MNCPECQDLLQRRLDGEALANLPDFERHLADCPACREQHQAALRLLDALRAVAKLALPDTLGPRIVFAVLRDRRTRQRRWWTGLAVAASLLLMALAGYLWWRPGDPQPKDDPIAKGKADAKALVQVEPSLNQSLDEARRAVGALTNRLAETTREQAKLLLPDPSDLPDLPAMPPLEVSLDPAVAPLRHTGQGVSEGVQTVARSAHRAMSYLVREIAQLEGGAQN